MDSELEELIKTVLADPEKINSLSEDDVIRLEKAFDPFAPSGSDNKEYINISIMNLREEYMRKLLMTSLVGYLFRTLDEWSPYEDYEEQRDEEMEKIIKDQVRRFLSRNLKYNPDKHVSSSHESKQKTSDPERLTKESLLESRLTTPAPSKIPDDILQNVVTGTYQTLVSVSSLLKSHASESDVFHKHYELANNLLKSVEPYAKYVCEKNTHDAVLIDPPSDVYLHWDRYITNNYEQLREVTNSLFCVKPDLEFAVHYYGHYNTKEDADAYKRKNESRFICPILTIENGAWTLLGPFLENRNRIDFYNKNTEILKNLFTQMESDQKLAKDIMKNKVIKKKKTEYASMGSDPKGLEEYKESLSTIEALGAKPLLSKDEKDKLKEAVRVKEMGEVPEDAIQVDYFKKDEKGNLVKGKFYTKADDPQPIVENMNMLRNKMSGGKILQDKHGKLISLEDAKKRGQPKDAAKK